MIAYDYVYMGGRNTGITHGIVEFLVGRNFRIENGVCTLEDPLFCSVEKKMYMTEDAKEGVKKVEKTNIVFSDVLDGNHIIIQAMAFPFIASTQAISLHKSCELVTEYLKALTERQHRGSTTLDRSGEAQDHR